MSLKVVDHALHGTHHSIRLPLEPGEHPGSSGARSHIVSMICVRSLLMRAGCLGELQQAAAEDCKQAASPLQHDLRIMHVIMSM